MGLEILKCCGAFIHVYSDTEYKHEPGCTYVLPSMDEIIMAAETSLRPELRKVTIRKAAEAKAAREAAAQAGRDYIPSPGVVLQAAWVLSR